MMILVMNCGSSSIKCQLFKDGKSIMKGNYERIGQDKSEFNFSVICAKNKVMLPARDFESAISEMFKVFVNKKFRIIDSLSSIDAIGFRIVHGGEYFKEATFIDEDVIEKIEACSELAPLHNPVAVTCIRACKKLLPDVPMVAEFDTSFHQTMEEKSFIYQIPYEYYEEYKIRKYGFHGTSHRYISLRVKELCDKEKMNIISCHLGQGASITAIENGKCVDTSMGYTPLAGIPMGSRSGDLDPSIIINIMKRKAYSPDEVEYILNKKSGLLGVSGISNDMRDVEKAAEDGDQRAILAIESSAYKIAQTIAMYFVSLKKVDAIAFAGGIGENDISYRKKICEYLTVFGIRVDDEKNNVRGEEAVISADDSSIKVLVIPTNEEKMIELDTKRIVESL